jgi:hypothetical protein
MNKSNKISSKDIEWYSGMNYAVVYCELKYDSVYQFKEEPSICPVTSNYTFLTPEREPCKFHSDEWWLVKREEEQKPSLAEFLGFKEGTLLEAVDPCIMQEDEDGTLIVGKVYRIGSVSNSSFSITDEDGELHCFTFEKASEYFKIVKDTNVKIERSVPEDTIINFEMLRLLQENNLELKIMPTGDSVYYGLYSNEDYRSWTISNESDLFEVIYCIKTLSKFLD